MSQPKEIIHEQLNTIREFINNPRKHHALWQDKPSFFQLASSLDAIGDTEQGIAAFLAKEFGDSKAAHYLSVYGLLQLLYVQQNAVNHLCKSLGIGETSYKYPRLNEIRNIRHESTGHPTKRDRREPYYHFISQISLSQSGFELLSYFSDGNFEHRYVDIPQLIADQKKYISEILAIVISELELEEKAHKEKFRMEKLSAIFPSTIGYQFEKLFECIRGGKLPGFGVGSLEIIKKTVLEFRNAVGRRDRAYQESLQDEYELIERAIDHLKKFCGARERGEEPEIEEATARIFFIFLKNQVYVLQQRAREFDEDYHG
jgi:hypothetical protein